MLHACVCACTPKAVGDNGKTIIDDDEDDAAAYTYVHGSAKSHKEHHVNEDARANADKDANEDDTSGRGGR